MAVLAEVRVPTSEFVLSDALEEVPNVRVEIKRVVAGAEQVTPYFWVFGDAVDAFERALYDDPDALEVLTLEEENPTERFFRVTWHQNTPNILTAVGNSQSTILDAVNTEVGQWELKILAPHRDGLAHCRDECVENGITFQLLRVYQPDNPPERAQFGLTEEQQEALEAAYDGGYFEIPRDMTMTDIAYRMGISRNALSARIRRGIRNLLKNTIIHEE